MDPIRIQQSIEAHIEAHSRFETRRDYVSMSQLGNCATQVALDYLNGYTVDAHTHRMCYAGYQQEELIRVLLMDVGVIAPAYWVGTGPGVEFTAPFDERLKGHPDGISVDGEIVEIKSVSKNQFKKVEEKERALWKHFVQCQMYMHYSQYKRALVIYRCRDDYQHKVIAMDYNRKMAQQFEQRAKLILKAIDGGYLPDCECGKHRDTT